MLRDVIRVFRSFRDAQISENYQVVYLTLSAMMKLNTLHNRMSTRVPASRPARIPKLVPRAVAAQELSPKEAGVEGAANQLEALKKMSKIVADSGVCPSHNGKGSGKGRPD